MNYSPEAIVRSWLTKSGFRVSPDLINRQLKGHPDYPSLLSITDTLDYLGIENMAVEIDKNQLHEVSTPFLAHIRTNGGEFVMVENRDTLEKVYPGFFEKWSGVVVAVEKTSAWRNKENEELIQKEKNSTGKKNFGFVLILLTVLTAIVFSPGWINTALMVVAMAGVFISWLIVSKDLGIENKIADQVCGKEADCDAVIHSKGAKLPFGTGWSDIGMLWFSSLMIVLILSSFAGFSTAVINILSLLTVAVIPFSFYSIFYQWRVAKKWCRLCLMTVALLWIQSAILLLPLLNISLAAIEWQGVFFIGSTLLLVSMAWFSVRSLLHQNKKLENDSFEGLRFKRNESIFLALLEKQRKVDINPWQGDLQLANVAAPLQIMVACNPYCGPCATTHEKLHDLIEKYGDRAGLTIRFTIDAKNKEDKRTQALEYLLQYIEQFTSDMNVDDKAIYSREILHQWFKLMDYDKFVAMYPDARETNVDDILQWHEEWTNRSKIAFTPTIFINGFEIPSHYRVNDLPGLINALSEAINNRDVINETDLIRT
jgi:thiol-disulfide isomerase/thioredoxin